MIYLLHFSAPISPNHTTQHYVGYTDNNLDSRLSDHRNGQAARLTQVALERGINFDVVRTWQGDKSDERRLKNCKNAKRYCPVCNEKAKNPQFLTKYEDY